MNELKDLGIALALICVPILALGAAVPLGRAIAAHLRGRDRAHGTDLNALEQPLSRRLEAIESAVGQIAIEVERANEGGRFIAKQLATHDVAMSPKISDNVDVRRMLAL